jgi:HD-GYP domain-containing protein (c-di-GMP phosphodiesterase class II)
MLGNEELHKQRRGEIVVEAVQLRPGVHVRLPVSWMEHQFMFNSFVIADEDQARQIAALHLPQIFCDLASCRVPPLPLPKIVLPPDPITQAEIDRLAALKVKQMAEKVERTKVMTELRGRLDTAQKHYVGAAKAVGGAFNAFDQHPEESVAQITEVSAQSTAALLADPDSAIVLIAEKAQADGNAAHSLSVMTLSLLLGKQARLPAEALRALGVGALLHDIGKNSISSSILRNTARNKHEEALYQTHCRAGYESALRAGHLTPPMLAAILHHHERMDGKGYPDGLSGKALHVAARIVGIADRFDTLSNPIDPRRALSPAEALATMWTKEQSAFDPVLLQLFVRAMGVYPPGSIVLLSDGRSGAVVASACTEKPLSPQVMIYEPEIPRRQAVIVDLAKEDGLKIERSLRLQERPDDELDYLLPRRKLNWFHTEGHG